MCGVLGIIGEHGLEEARSLLLLLHHRGQDGCGMVWFHGDHVYSSKALGSPERLSIPKNTAGMILGSTRYPTSGRRLSSESELDLMVGPFVADSLALTHNGNITNIRALTKTQYDCDSKFILDRLHANLQKAEGDLVRAFRLLENEVDGAFSLVGVYRDQLFAYRDSRGFKPLVFGHSDNKGVVASESTVLDMAGIELERDVYPGELLIFNRDGHTESYSIMQGRHHSHCFFEYVYFAHPAARIENQLVYDVRFRLGRALAQLFRKRGLEPPDYVVPVPDTSRPAAQALAEELQVPMREVILKNRYLGRTFIAQTQEERDRMARNKYLYLEDKVRGRNLLIVDDSIVRGTTAKMMVADLRRLGARRVYFAVTSPPQIHPCYYGIDISTSRELIASHMNEDEICRFIGADALIYQDLNSLVNAIGMKDNCLACLNGQYPTEYARAIWNAVTRCDQLNSAQAGRDYERVIG